MPAQPLPESEPLGDQPSFAGAEQMRELADSQRVADVVDINSAPSAQREELTPEVIKRNRQAAAERWEERSVSNYGDFRYKRKAAGQPDPDTN